LPLVLAPPIEREANSSIASGHIGKMQVLLNNGFNLMITGAPGIETEPPLY
jgi:hypothetical protein